MELIRFPHLVHLVLLTQVLQPYTPRPTPSLLDPSPFDLISLYLSRHSASRLSSASAHACPGMLTAPWWLPGRHRVAPRLGTTCPHTPCQRTHEAT